AHQGRQIERDGEAGLPLREQVMVAAVGFLRRGEAGELAHGPELAPVHIAMDASRVREFAGRGKLSGRRRLVERLYFHAAGGGEAALREPNFAHLYIYFNSYQDSAAGGCGVRPS